tara:strand:- start:2071 stop:2574 length:504 start_codon:yes stop_codon:yes gene_type:complete
MVLKIAFGGVMGSGKDTCVDYLCTKYPEHTRISFAGALYDILSYAQEKCGFEKNKDRKFLQFIGTEWARNIDENVWINIVLDKDIKGIGLLSDIRFLNEFNALKNNGWICIKVTRDNIDKNRVGNGDNTHSSELSINDIKDEEWDFIINNNSTLEDLYKRLDKIFKY